MKMTSLIFDFDGTIAYSFSLACEIILNHAKELNCRQLKESELPALKNEHAREVLRALEVPFWRIPFFVHKTRALVNKQIDRLCVFPEWPLILQQLKQDNYQLGLISSNSAKTIGFVLKKYHLFETFDFICCERSLFGKKRALTRLIKEKKISASSSYYIGDEARDIEAAHAAKIESIAVTWGFNSSKQLLSKNPTYLVHNMTELRHIFGLASLS
jgi:phosphoglycolate phosphatase